jgi:hypothetical protein
MPVSLILTASTAIGNKFQLERTFQTGEIVFSNNGTGVKGATYGNILLMEDQFFDDYETYAHEFTHIYQYYDYNFVNTYLNKPYSKWSEKSKTFSKINKLFYIDLNGAVLRPLYLLENQSGSNYYDNFFENEARFYSRTEYRD